MVFKGWPILAVMVLSACGGGTGVLLQPPIGPSTQPPPEILTYSPIHQSIAPAQGVYDPQAISALMLAVTGTPSEWRGDGDHGLASAVLPDAVYGDWRADALTITRQPLLPDRHLRDTAAADAWAQGWTGKGQTIGIIDDFEDPIDAYLRLTLARRAEYLGQAYDYDVTYRASLPTSHGDLVANIAGGDAGAGLTEHTVDLTATSVMLRQCAGGTSCQAPPLALFDVSAADVSWHLMAGVAAEADVQRAQVDLSETQDPDLSLAAVLDAVDEGWDFEALNLSIGFTLRDRSLTYDGYAEYLSRVFGQTPLENASDAVIAIAAGNSGGDCGEDLWGCNAYAVAGTVFENTRKNVIVVGATSDAGGAETIAAYSTRAGVLQDRFMVANGQTGVYRLGAMGQLDEIVGTSFATPRVAGAAAVLRQKFPDLSGEDAASVLLLSASKDIDGDGNPDFEGTSSIYGHGRLDLAAALSPIGSLAVR